MKKILLLTISLVAFNSVFADCASSGMEFFPRRKNISLKSMFIIQGYGESQKTVNSFKNRKIFLESEHGKLIELSLLEILKGEMSLTQAIFKPVEKLDSNTKYYLKYSDITKNELEEMFEWNPKTKKNEKVYWQTTDMGTLDLLSADIKINYEKNEVIHYGCGPSVNAVFNVINKNDVEIFYKTEVVELSTNKTTVFYITEWKDKLEVGHNMCSGAFQYKNKGKYKVRFTPTNADGESLKTTDWKIFDSPFLSDKWNMKK